MCQQADKPDETIEKAQTFNNMTQLEQDIKTLNDNILNMIAQQQEMKLFIVDYLDSSSNEHDYVLTVAKTINEAKEHFTQELKDTWGLDENDDLPVEQIEAHPIEEVYGYKILLRKEDK